MRAVYPLLLCGTGLCCACASADGGLSAEGEGATVSTSEARLLVGYYTKDNFNDLNVVPDCPVLWGLQGGNWTMPTLRAQNVQHAVTVSGTLELDTDTLGQATLQANLLDRTDGWQELTYLPIPVSHPVPNDTLPLDDLYGRSATLSFLLTDQNGTQLSASYPVTLLRSEVTE